MVYTFNLLKKYKALDINAVWSVLSSVTQKGSDQVVMQFKQPAVTYFYYIADQIGDRAAAHLVQDRRPGQLPGQEPGRHRRLHGQSTCTPQNINYKANPHYWQPGLPKVETINYPAFLTNDTANTYLANGQAQWGSQFIPSIQKFYLAKSPNYHYWFPPVANVTLFINLTNPILKNVAVRQAMAYAINRQQGVADRRVRLRAAVQPDRDRHPDVLQLAGHLAGRRSTATTTRTTRRKAISILKAAGYTKGSDGIMQKNGQKLSFTILNNGGFSDWVAAVQRDPDRPQGGRHPGHAEEPGRDHLPDRLYNGKYQLGYGAETGGPTPYYELRQWLYSANSAPIGTAAGSNFERYSNPADRRADQRVRRRPTDPAEQHSIVNQLQKVMLQRGAGHPGHRVGGLVPVRHRQLHRLGHPGQPVRAAGRVQLPGLGAADAAPVAEVGRGSTRGRAAHLAGRPGRG